MRILGKELLNNRKKVILFNIILIFTLLFFYFILASAQYSNDNKLDKLKNGAYIDFFNKDINFEEIKEIWRDEKISEIIVSYNFPENFHIDANYHSDNRVAREISSILTREKIMINSGKLPEFDSNEEIIAISKIFSLDKGLKIGDKYKFDGHALHIVGFTDIGLNDGFAIPFKLKDKLKLTIERIQINPQDGLNDRERVELFKSLIEKLGNKYSLSTDGALRKVEEKHASNLLTVGALSVMNLMFILYYILEERRKKYHIYIFNGIKKIDLHKILLAEISVYFLIDFVISIILFYFIDFVIFRQIFGIIRYNLTINSIIFSFVMLYILLIVVSFIRILMYFRKSAMEIYKQ